MSKLGELGINCPIVKASIEDCMRQLFDDWQINADLKGCYEAGRIIGFQRGALWMREQARKCEAMRTIPSVSAMLDKLSDSEESVK